MTTANPHKASELSDEQRDLLKAVDEHIREHSRPPTWRELSDLTGEAVSTIRDRATRLEAMGYLRTDPGTARSLALTAPAFAAIRHHARRPAQEA